MDSSVDGVVSSADGVSIQYRVEGDGEPVLLFVHCWTCDCHFWDHQVAHFAKRRRVVTLDLAGHGHSGRNREDWTMAAFGNDVRVVIEVLKQEHLVLIGHSMGGPVVLEAARGVPEGRLVGVIAVDSLHDLNQALDASTIDEQLQRFNRDYKAATARLETRSTLPPFLGPYARRAGRSERNIRARGDRDLGVAKRLGLRRPGGSTEAPRPPFEPSTPTASPPTWRRTSTYAETMQL